MDVWHTYARYYNFGDHALGVGMRNIMARYFSNRAIFRTYDCHRTYFGTQLISEMNRASDLLLVGGGGLIFQYKGKWLFNMPDAMISAVEAPMIFYGLGYNVFRGEEPAGPEVLGNIKLLQSKAVSFSVRNDGSRERLAALGLELPEVPDPGFFLDGDYTRPKIDGRFVVIQLANDVPQYRGFVAERLVASMSEVVRHLLDADYTVVLAPHVEADISLSQSVIDAVGPSPRLRMWDWYYHLRDENLLEGLAYYKHASMVIGMRGHSQIIPIGMGTPVISVVNHDKIRGLLDKLEVASLCVEVGADDLAARLIGLVGEVESRREQIVSQYAAAMRSMTQATREFVGAMRGRFDEFDKKRVRTLPPPPKPAPKKPPPKPPTFLSRVKRRVRRMLER